MAIDKEPILDYLSTRDGHGRGRTLHEAFYYLMRIIFLQKEFEDYDHLVAFCGQPANLSEWLVNENDQVIFAAGLRDALLDLRAETEASDAVRKARRPALDGREPGTAEVFRQTEAVVNRYP